VFDELTVARWRGRFIIFLIAIVNIMMRPMVRMQVGVIVRHGMRPQQTGRRRENVRVRLGAAERRDSGRFG
jgi:hypothetical protein